jgi:predicted nucleic acid-binding protein
MRFVDTNVLLYSISTDARERRKRDIARALLDADDIGLSVQVLQEFHVQATRASRADRLEASLASGLVLTWLRFAVQDVTTAVLLDAMAISQRFGFSYWDSAIVAAARALGCRELLTEDMSHGQALDGLLIRDPFLDAVT